MAILVSNWCMWTLNVEQKLTQQVIQKIQSQIKIFWIDRFPVCLLKIKDPSVDFKIGSHQFILPQKKWKKNRFLVVFFLHFIPQLGDDDGYVWFTHLSFDFIFENITILLASMHTVTYSSVFNSLILHTYTSCKQISSICTESLFTAYST